MTEIALPRIRVRFRRPPARIVYMVLITVGVLGWIGKDALALFEGRTVWDWIELPVWLVCYAGWRQLLRTEIKKPSGRIVTRSDWLFVAILWLFMVQAWLELV